MVAFLIMTSMFFSLLGLCLFFDPTIDDDTYGDCSTIQKAIGSALVFFAVLMLVIAFNIAFNTSSCG